MAHHPMLRDLLFRLPPATAVLVLSTLFATTAEGHALPRQTTTVEFHELNVIAWPPVPTEAPLSPYELLRRQEDNTVCGFIGGNSGLPATCSAGSHCVLDTNNNVMGCCPNGGACTAGVFTGCVDYNSGAQTEVNPYVYTCQGSDVCYKNEFGGGIFQYGCGTSSDLATTVETSVSGVNALVLPASSVALTETPTSLSEPTSINPNTGTRSFSSISKISLSFKSSSTSASTSSSSSTSSASSSSSSSTSTTTSSSSSSTSSSSSSSTSSTTSSSASAAGSSSSSTTSSAPTAAPATGSSFDRTGAIVGGTISGVAILVALIAIVLFYLRKRRNNRKGPGPQPAAPPTTEYMSPMRSHGAAFAPLPTWQEEEEPATPQPRLNQPYSNQPYSVADQPANMYNEPRSAPDPPVNTYNPYDMGVAHSTFGGDPSAAGPVGYDPVHVAGGGVGGTPIADTYTRSDSREIDDFSHGYTAALGHMQDEDRQPLTVVNPDDHHHDHDYDHDERPGSPIRNSDRPLWQQNRRQSRNLMWM
ncbi:hypothetical protein JX265_011418 [Neoarthrinium moseri]|uniref:Uncharacterized protein n=1 Tax=Neoarthrinium moseri TaxID=1658444 RepID=A0A9P9WC16_9PEZI|nr:hypothetical protein JX265_011418 [Neoarthrinium moseri]